MTIAKGSRVTVQDEGVTQGVVGTLNFTGAGVVASVSGNTASVNVTGGGGGSFALTSVMVNMGTTPVWRGRFVITDAAISTASLVLIFQAPGPYTGKGTRADEAEMQAILAWAEPSIGQATVRWQTVEETRTNMMSASPAVTSTGVTTDSAELRRTYEARFVTKRVGKVRGNIRFFYMIG